MRIMRRDPSNARIHGEGNLDHFVECRLIAAGAQRAIIRLLVHGFECMGDVKHPAAAWAKHIPGQIKQSKSRSVQKPANGLFLVEAVLSCERNHIDAA
jgi:hypothetical protein